MTGHGKALRHPALALTALAVAAGLLVWSMTTDSYARSIEAARRLEALNAEEEVLLVGVSVSGASGASPVLPDAVVWHTTELSAAELALQQSVLVAAESASLQLVSFGGTGAFDNGPVPTFGFEAELEGGHDGLVMFLAALEQAQPRSSVANLWMRQLPPLSGEPSARISIRITLWGFAPELAKGEQG